MQQLDLAINGGTVVGTGGRVVASVGVRNGKIAALAAEPLAAAETVDATGKIVLPGGIDPHVHLNAEMPQTPRPGATVDDYASGSAAAIAGGVTTISNMVSKQPNETVDAFMTRVLEWSVRG